MSVRLRIALAAAGLALSAGTSLANNGAAIVLGETGQRLPLMTVAQPDSGALILYYDTDTTPFGIYAQRVDRNGKPTFADPVLVTTNLNLYSNGLLADGAGGALLTLVTQGGASGEDIVVHRVTSTGTLPYGPNGLVVCNAPLQQTYPALVPGVAGAYYYVCWTDYRAAQPAPDIYVQRVDLAGMPQWAANGIVVNAAADRSSSSFSAVSDFAGGLCFAWEPWVGSGCRAQRIDLSGIKQWGVNGATFGNSTVRSPTAYPDGVGGFWATHSTWDGTYAHTFVHRILSNGTSTLAPAGVEVYSYPQTTPGVHLLRSASGGCTAYISTWSAGSGRYFIYRRSISSTGQLTPEEPLFSTPQSISFFDHGSSFLRTHLEMEAAGGQRLRLRLQRLALDGTPTFPEPGLVLGPREPVVALSNAAVSMLPNGVIAAAWGDGRYQSGSQDLFLQVFGQAVTPAGAPLWPDTEIPTIKTLADAPGDQGGFVRVTWEPGTPDHPFIGTLRGYRVWRSLPASQSAALAAARAADPGEDGPANSRMFASGERTFLAHAGSYWELAGEQPAATLSGYARTVTTLQDSTSAGPADEVFMVEAYDDSSHHWFTGTLTGRSVDNLPPAAVTNAIGLYSGGTTQLFWNGVADADLWRYEVFRGTSPAFVPSAANRVGTTGSLMHADPSGAPAYYRIAARDVHENLGPSALVVPMGTADADAAAPREWALRSVWNARASTVDLTLDLPVADDGRLELFDVAGRRIWSAPYRAEIAQSLVLRASPDRTLRSGVVYARLTSRTGRVMTSKAVIVR